eukprot:3895426-Rhodomonas_salina.1
MGEEKKAERQGFCASGGGRGEGRKRGCRESGHLRKGESCQQRQEEEWRGGRGETLLWRREKERRGGRGTSEAADDG